MGQGSSSSNGRRITAFEWEVYRKTFYNNWKRRRPSRPRKKRSRNKRDN